MYIKIYNVMNAFREKNIKNSKFKKVLETPEVTE